MRMQVVGSIETNQPGRKGSFVSRLFFHTPATVSRSPALDGHGLNVFTICKRVSYKIGSKESAKPYGIGDEFVYADRKEKRWQMIEPFRFE